MPRQLTAEMKKLLKAVVRGEVNSFSKNTLNALITRGFAHEEGRLTNEGWRQAVVMLPLREQCNQLGIGYDTLPNLLPSPHPEMSAFKYFQSQGFKGAYCEGGPILLLIKAACLGLLVKLNTFSSRNDACNRFTEAQLTINQQHSDLFTSAIKNSSCSEVIRNFEEIYNSLMIQECYPGITSDAIAALYKYIGANKLAEITAAIIEAPYVYRAGWPDLTITNEHQIVWGEVKTTDRLHMSQVTTLQRMKSILPGSVKVIHLVSGNTNDT